MCEEHKDVRVEGRDDKIMGGNTTLTGRGQKRNGKKNIRK